MREKKARKVKGVFLRRIWTLWKERHRGRPVKVKEIVDYIGVRSACFF